MRDTLPDIGSFVALGDSFTEGLGDPYPGGAGHRGWADRFAERLAAGPTTQVTGRIVALTSDHTAHNLPYGASKGALDRIVVAAAVELAGSGIRANVINPGPIDTGWMDAPIRAAGVAQTPAGRLGTPNDTADLVRFLMSDAGGWINGQVLYSNGGFKTPS